jgi:type II secretory pathway component PulJ
MAKRGRPRVLESPDELYRMWNEYKSWVKANPIMVHDFVGKDATEVWRAKERPLTRERFYVYVMENYGINIHQYFDNTNGTYNEYLDIITRITDERRTNQLEGGMVGIFHPNLTARLNGITEKTETTTIVHTMNIGQ